MRGLFACVGLCAVAFAVAQKGPGVSGVIRADNTPLTDQMGIEQRLGNQIPLDLPLRADTGAETTFREILKPGRALLIMPMFYNCQGICLIEQDQLVKTLVKMREPVGKDFDVVMFGINPTETSDLARAKKNQVLELYVLGRKNKNQSTSSAESGFHYLTASLDSIQKVTEALGFKFSYNPSTGNINHPAGIMTMTPDGKVSSYIYGKDYPTRVLERDLEAASRGEIGKRAEIVLLGCIRVDPATGKRTIIVENVLRVLCVATVVGLILSIVTMNRKNRANLPREGGSIS
jgi:protein SCO1/2